MKSNLLNLALMLTAITLSGFAASPGSLDSSFGVGGIVKPTLLGTQLIADVAVGKNGEIVTVGTQTNPDDFLIIRHIANGNLDTNFGVGGIVTTDFAGGADSARSVRIQTDGKPVVCGSSNTVDNSGIARYNFDGGLDTTFDADGKRTITSVSCEALAIQPDGKIIGVGDSINTDLVVFRLNPNGSLDTSFGVGGFASVTGGGNGIKTFLNVELQPDGKIVAGGSFSSNLSVIARFNSNGTLDGTFDGDGLLIFDLPGDFGTINDFSIDPNSNKFVAVGGVKTGSISDLVVVRFTTNGGFDPTFSGDGILQTNLSQRAVGGIKADVLLQSDGKILVSASTSPFNPPLDQLILLRLDVNGNFDNSFGNNGISSNDKLFSLFEGELAFSGDKLVVASHEVTTERDFQITRHNLLNTPSQSSDFDGDGVSDIAVYRPSQGLWIILNSSNNSAVFRQFGLNGDIPIDGDFDGDGRSDLSIYRPSNGLWFVEKSSDRTNFARQFGTSTDKPTTNDYDKDGKADIAFFRPSNGEWFFLRSSDNFNSFFSTPFGLNGDIPISKKGP